MNREQDIQKNVADTFEVAGDIEKVPISPFFKEKTMRRLFLEKETQYNDGIGFVPKLQLAVVVCVVVINFFAIVELYHNKYEENVTNFADALGLSINTNKSLFN